MNTPTNKSRLRRKPDFDRLNLIPPLDLVATILEGLADGLLDVIPVETRLPEPICRAISERWKDQAFHRDMRVKISTALSTVLRQKLPGAVADPIADAMTNQLIYPVVRRCVEHLLRRSCGKDDASEHPETRV